MSRDVLRRQHHDTSRVHNGRNKILTIHSLVTPDHRKIRERIVKKKNIEKKGGGRGGGGWDETVESSQGMMGGR